MESIILAIILVILIFIYILLNKIYKTLELFQRQLGQSSYDISEQMKGLWRVIKYYDLKAKEEKKEI